MANYYGGPRGGVPPTRGGRPGYGGPGGVGGGYPAPQIRGGGGYDDYDRYRDPIPGPAPGPRLMRTAPPPVAEPMQRAPRPGSAQQPGPPGPGGVKYANDCEIIVTAKTQQQYGEMIEQSIRDMKLKVDIMFPKQDVKLSAFIENIAALGTIFAVVIRPDNEAHRSVSVHVLRGVPRPEEHRNMPLTAAFQLIRDRYIEMKRREVGIVPDNMKVILKQLLDEKTLSDKEYCTVIKFLQDRRRKLKAFEHRTNNVINEGDDDLLDNPDATELKQRILAIMNGNIPVDDGGRTSTLTVPKPKEPLGALGPDPLGAAESRGAGRGYGRGRGQPYR